MSVGVLHHRSQREDLRRHDPDQTYASASVGDVRAQRLYTPHLAISIDHKGCNNNSTRIISSEYLAAAAQHRKRCIRGPSSIRDLSPRCSCATCAVIAVVLKDGSLTSGTYTMSRSQQVPDLWDCGCRKGGVKGPTTLDHDESRHAHRREASHPGEELYIRGEKPAKHGSL